MPQEYYKQRIVEASVRTVRSEGSVSPNSQQDTAKSFGGVFESSSSSGSDAASYVSDDDGATSRGKASEGALVSVGTIYNLKLEAQRLAKQDKPSKKLRPQGAGLSATAAVIIQKAFRCVRVPACACVSWLKRYCYRAVM